MLSLLIFILYDFHQLFKHQYQLLYVNPHIHSYVGIKWYQFQIMCIYVCVAISLHILYILLVK